jgi:CRISPR type III-associated protein (TIGR04423 family)
MRKNQTQIIEYINSLKGYQGYVQFSDRAIEDIFATYADIFVEQKGGFVYEAHFCNGAQSIAIKQINDSWLIDETDLSSVSKEDTQIYHAIGGHKVKMAQVWAVEPDELCEGMMAKKLKKVVFVGFEGAVQKNETVQKVDETSKQKYTDKQKEILLEHFLTLFNEEYISNILAAGESK